MGRQDSAVADSTFSILGLLAQGLSRFAYTVLIGRVLGASDLADVNFAFAVAILLSLVGPTAAGNAAAAFAGRTAHARALLRIVVGLIVALSSAGAALGWLVVGTHAFAVQCALLTAGWCGYIVGRGVFVGAGRVRAAASWDIITGVLALVLLLGVLAAGWVTWILLPAIIGYGVFATAAAFTRLSSATSEADRVEGGYGRFVLWNSLALIATNGLMQMSMVVSSAFDTGDAAGQFAAALSLATPLSMVAQGITQVMLPRFASWRALDDLEHRKAARRAAGALTGVLVAGGAVVALILPFALPLVYGPAFRAAVGLAQGLMVAVVFFSLSVFFAAHLAATDRAHVSTLLAGIGFVAGAAVMGRLAVTVGGNVGAVVGASVGMIVSAVLLAAASLCPRWREGERTYASG